MSIFNFYWGFQLVDANNNITYEDACADDKGDCQSDEEVIYVYGNGRWKPTYEWKNVSVDHNNNLLDYYILPWRRASICLVCLNLRVNKLLRDTNLEISRCVILGT
jgi:hypothetical protein